MDEDNTSKNAIFHRQIRAREGYRDAERIKDRDNKNYKSQTYDALTQNILQNHPNWSNDEIREWICKQRKRTLQNLIYRHGPENLVGKMKKDLSFYKSFAYKLLKHDNLIPLNNLINASENYRNASLNNLINAVEIGRNANNQLGLLGNAIENYELK